MELKAGHYAGIAIGFLIVTGSVIFLIGTPYMFFLIVVGLIVSTLPFLISFLGTQKNKKEKEQKFLEFARDLVENVRSGTPISKGIMNLKKRNYGALNPHVVKLSNQLSIGMTLKDALTNFATDIDSKVISRAVGLISEAERAGGNIATILQSVADSINQIEVLKKQRKAAVSNLVTQGYIIFIVFIVIMLVLQYAILPMVGDIGGGGEEGLGGGESPFGGLGGDGGSGSDPEAVSRTLLFLLLVQSFFAGLVIGKISEGSVKGGIKHSFILLALTLLISSGANIIFGGEDETAIEAGLLLLTYSRYRFRKVI